MRRFLVRAGHQSLSFLVLHSQIEVNDRIWRSILRYSGAYNKNGNSRESESLLKPCWDADLLGPLRPLKAYVDLDSWSQVGVMPPGENLGKFYIIQGVTGLIIADISAGLFIDTKWLYLAGDHAMRSIQVMSTLLACNSWRTDKDRCPLDLACDIPCHRHHLHVQSPGLERVDSPGYYLICTSCKPISSSKCSWRMSFSMRKMFLRTDRQIGFGVTV